MVRWQQTLLALASACCALGAVTLASAAESATVDPVVMATDTAGVVTAPAPLKRWTIAITAASVNRDDITEIDRVDAPASEADRRGGGVGLSFGYLFGDRFLLALQGVLAQHQTGSPDIQLYDMEFLLTGTVLFRSRATFQPFLRGGFGVSLLVERNITDDIIVFGPSAIAGGGFQLRLARWLSLEVELVGTFANYIEATRNQHDPEVSETWNVRTSSAGTRSGLALYFWF
jgi:hypothetical protein